MAAGFVIQKLLIAGGLASTGSGGGPDVAGHEQFIGVRQFLRQQPIKLIFQPQRPLPTRRPVSHVLPRDAAPPTRHG
jgi:hypothetical protein